MDASRGPIWFLGDLADPWLGALVEALSAVGSVQRWDCGNGPVPELPWDGPNVPSAIVVHRNHWHAVDSERARAWRAARDEDEGESAAPWLVLCTGPYLRRDDAERWAGLVDWTVPDAIAAELLPHRLARRWHAPWGGRTSSAAPTFQIEVAGNDRELTALLVETCQAAGRPAVAVDDLEIEGPTARVGATARERGRSAPAAPHTRVLTLWETPVLESGWAERLERRARRFGPVIVLAGFLDRALVATARSHGAAMCLELPCDADDLTDAVERVVATRPPESWPVPPRFEPPHTLPPRRHQRAAAQASARVRERETESRAAMRPGAKSGPGPVPPSLSDRGPLPLSDR